MSPAVVIDKWFKDIIVDPLSKENLIWNSKTAPHSSYGRRYFCDTNRGIYDFKVLLSSSTPDQKRWQEGQVAYEALSLDIAKHDGIVDYKAEIDGMRPVYEAIPIVGRCLDIGGHQGRLRHFLAPDQEYASCDPFVGVFDDLESQPKLLEAYPFLREPVNFVCCNAEFLPFASETFDVAHMRSVMDHFLNPELSLHESYRVLRKSGYLVVGLHIEGGLSGSLSLWRRLRVLARKGLGALGLTKFIDHHVWHPSYEGLTTLIKLCGFEVVTEYWQDKEVVYLKAVKVVSDRE